MAGKRPKQFLELAGTPIIIHTLNAFEQCEVIHEIIIVLAAEETEGFLSLAKDFGLRKIKAVVPGGTTRAESVFNGLQAITAGSTEIVAVHDGVRPFVTAGEIARTVEAARLEGAAILVSAPIDTMKQVNNGVVIKTIRRDQVRQALTPQCFRYDLLRRAYEGTDCSDVELTDESALVERLGVRIVTVEGSARNIKLTQPEDLLIGEALLKQMNLEL